LHFYGKNSAMRWIYISPHLDDAVLSAGGLIYEQAHSGLTVEIWSLTSGFPPEGDLSPFAQALHFQWGFSSGEEAVRLRRAEDERAASMLGAATLHFDFLDCIYRRAPSGEWLYPLDVFDPPAAEDADLPAQMAAALSARLKPDDELVCQLEVGHHVDHIHVRRAVELLGRPLLYDADLPYVLNSPTELESNTAGMKETSYTVTEAGLRAWQEAILSYSSQISTLFDSPDQMRESIRTYWQGKGGIGLWKFE